MARPKGSKNKSTIGKDGAVSAQLESLVAERDKLNADKTTQESIILDAQEKLKAIKRDIRKIETKIKHLEAKKAEADAALVAAEKKRAIEAKVHELIDSGKETDAIIDALNKL